MRTATVRILLCGGLWMSLLAALSAEELLPGANWAFTGDQAEAAKLAFDRDLATRWSSDKPQANGVGLNIDFGQPVAVHRMIIDPGEGEALLRCPRSLRCSMGETPDSLKVFHDEDYSAESGRPLIDLRFNARKGRFLRIEIGSQGAAYPWWIAELRIYGFQGKDDLEARDAVVMSDNMPSPYREERKGQKRRDEHLFYNIPDDVGARDLSYYLGEITGWPVPLVRASDQARYSGTLYILEEPKLLQYEKGNILHREEEAAHVYRKGREVRFAGHTPVGVYNSVTEFLDRQGVRWLFPSAYGDFISQRGGVDLSLLPIDYAPQIVMRHCGGGPTGFAGSQYWRPHHWNKGHGNSGSSYRQYGHHGFAYLVPPDLYAKHPDWFPMFKDPKWEDWLKQQGHKLGDRVCRTGAHGFTFCTSSPEAREYIVAQTVAKAKANPEFHALSVGQMDTDFWCECPRCRAQDKGEPVVDETTSPPAVGKGNRIADLAAYLGRRFQEELPDRTIQVGTLAYISSAYAPAARRPLPNNVSVNLVICSIPGYRVWLPPDSSTNRKAVEALKGWAGTTQHLCIYTWDLLMPGSEIPAATITGSAEWFRLWKQLGVDGKYTETCLHPESLWRMNPWCYYTYSRLCWNPDEPAEKIFHEFFSGYFQEAAEPMMAYYKTLEDHLRKNNLDYGGSSYQLQAKPEVFTPSILKTMLRHLKAAEAAAAKHYVTRRRVVGIRRGFDKVTKSLDIRGDDLK